MIDEAGLTLFLYILMRMTGFVVFNPLWGRMNVPAMVKAGVSLVMAVFVGAFAVQNAVAVPATAIELALRLLLELALGYLVAVVMHCFFYVPLLAGHMIDAQMGMNMSENYDPAMGTNVSLTSTLLNIMLCGRAYHTTAHFTRFRPYYSIWIGCIRGAGGFQPSGAVRFLYSAGT